MPSDHPAPGTGLRAPGGGSPGPATGLGPAPPRPAGIHELLGAEIIEYSPERVVMSLPVDHRVHQPYGILHGGVSALLAESAASLGGAVSVPPGKHVVGIELNASHLRSLREGTLIATATPIRKGRTIHVWGIRLTDQHDRPICHARCTLAVIDSPGRVPEGRGSGGSGADGPAAEGSVPGGPAAEGPASDSPDDEGPAGAG
jgi:1,4-dihydroxy-2-naphthoyl-CoA hydrolase